MKNKERFDRAISSLVKGYMNDTLVKGNCAACAVGNIIAAGLDHTVKKIDRFFTFYGFIEDYAWQDSETTHIPFWTQVFCTTKGVQDINECGYSGLAKKQIESTGYSWQDLAKIEKAFEENTKMYYYQYESFDKKSIQEDQYNGLMAVITVLCEIEGIEDLQPYKELFNNKCLV